MKRGFFVVFNVERFLGDFFYICLVGLVKCVGMQFKSGFSLGFGFVFFVGYYFLYFDVFYYFLGDIFSVFFVRILRKVMY